MTTRDYTKDIAISLVSDEVLFNGQSIGADGLDRNSKELKELPASVVWELSARKQHIANEPGGQFKSEVIQFLLDKLGLTYVDALKQMGKYQLWSPDPPGFH